MRQRAAAERQEKRKQNTAGSQPSASQAGDEEDEEGLIVVPSAASISNAEVGRGPCRVPSVRSAKGKGGEKGPTTGPLPAPGCSVRGSCVCRAGQDGGLVVVPSAVSILNAELVAEAPAGGF